MDGQPYSNTLAKTRLRVASICLTITGLRISEIRYCKISQIMTLLNRHYVRIHLSKRGRSSHKAFLAPKGKRLIQKHREDFLRVLLNRRMILKK